MKNTLKSNHLGTVLSVFLQTNFFAVRQLELANGSPGEEFFLSFQHHLTTLEERLALLPQSKQVLIKATGKYFLLGKIEYRLEIGKEIIGCPFNEMLGIV